MKPLLKILKSYGAPTDDLLEFYCLVIRLILEYGVAIWNHGTTNSKTSTRLICPNQNYDQVLIEMNLQTLEECKDELCISLVRNTVSYTVSYQRNVDNKSKVRHRLFVYIFSYILSM